MKKPGLLLGIAVIVATLAYGSFEFGRSQIGTVNFREAALAGDESVQIVGAPVSQSMVYDTAEHKLKFRLRDEAGAIMPVEFKGQKPDDLDTAMQKGARITAQGTYDAQGHYFSADNLLVKCPSKYQGQSTDKTYTKS